MKRIKQDTVTVSALSRTARRAVLAATLLVASPAIADEAVKTSVRILPPPALEGESQGVQQVALHQNPFYEPQLKPISDPNVKLASSQRRSAIRLKETTAEIGLVPIGTTQPLSVPVTIRPRALKIETPVASPVQSNPLIDSAHHSNPDLINTNVTMPNERLEELELTRRGADLAPAIRIAPRTQIAAQPQLAAPQVAVSQVVAQPQVAVQPKVAVQPQVVVTPNEVLKQLQPTLQPAIQAVPRAMPVAPAIQPAPVKSAVQPIPAQPAIAAELPKPIESANQAERVPTVQPEAQEMPVLVAVPKSEPVTFSLSDDAKSDDAEVTSPSDAGSEESNIAAQEIVPQKSNDLVPAKSVDPQPTAELQPIKELADDGSVQSHRSVTRKPSVVTQPVVLEPIKLTDKAKPHSRYRAPVAVAAPPISIANGQAKAVASKPAAPVRGLQVNTTQKKKSGLRAPTKLHLTRAQVKSLSIGGLVRRIDVGNQGVCQAIATGPSQLKLIGTGNGVTRLVVWADAKNSPTRVRTFEIHVEDAVETTGDSIGSKMQMLNHSILVAFPNANVSVQQFQNRLIVSGDCDSEDVAKKIIRMVRKTCLVPVRDEIRVR